MKIKPYLALLRGINVGGNHIIKMADLKDCFERAGLSDVSTYIQSGNVLFGAPEKDGESLERILEAALLKRFKHDVSVFVLSRDELKGVVRAAPKGFGGDPDAYRYDVIFLKKPLNAAPAMKSVSVKGGVDAASLGEGVLYFSRLISKATQSRLSKVTQMPVYKSMTIRNWNTTTKLLALMDAR